MNYLCIYIYTYVFSGICCIRRYDWGIWDCFFKKRPRGNYCQRKAHVRFVSYANILFTGVFLMPGLPPAAIFYQSDDHSMQRFQSQSWGSNQPFRVVRNWMNYPNSDHMLLLNVSSCWFSLHLQMHYRRTRMVWSQTCYQVPLFFPRVHCFPDPAILPRFGLPPKSFHRYCRASNANLHVLRLVKPRQSIRQYLNAKLNKLGVED